ncbi:phenylalanyl-tRNA synthetase beta subunit [Hasllibacter halocynthiae]|uniref:Phenylalanine--tRNA ligase beta subunit n=1 Tax=Hasllibacter halocynthiae TaxID=595589 RepID=A0A2T0X3Y8_9RHOB|nr:phenylalanine--tRNA ligase subunit beta [Hasllibacter halocynthiae]PRY93663.1 phenylalanyl-tRNA synthetase beta subunit [Hasllibacter halocynthiae]
MKFTLSWLKSHLETDASVDEIAETLTDLGLEVEGVTNPGDTLRPFRIGYVEAAEKHPDADRLKVCRVRTAAGVKQIVCGAPNAREGITVVVAEPGTYVPGIGTTIRVGKIRGVESHGMMASEREMELSDEHDGIIELPSGEVGESFADWLAANEPGKVDPVIEIAVTPNRPDALGVRGVARDLAARGLGQLKPRDAAPVEGTFPSPVGVTIDEGARGACPVFYGRLIRGVRNGPSPEWLQRQLKAIGLRPISFLVDVTNWFTFDRNRPLHVFDAAKVKGDLRVHLAEGGERLVALDEKEYEAIPGAVLISDDDGVESLGGIMGGEATGVTDGTTDVFLEAAYFDPVRTALTGRALRIHSDARYRFERGIDPEWTPEGIEHATRMILDHAGGEASEVVVAGTIPETARSYAFDPCRLRTLVGMDVPEAEQRAALEALGFRVEGGQAHVPPWRPDVQGDADIVEEVARIASLAKLEGVPMPRPAGVPEPVLTPAQRRERAARRQAAALGYAEAVTYSFVAGQDAEAFGGGGEAVRLDNPISSEMSHLRPSLLPGLLRAAARNQSRGRMDLALFECGYVFDGGEPGEQRLTLAGLLVGRTGPKDVHGEGRARDLFDAKADLEAVLAAAGAPPRAQTFRDLPGWWHPGRSARLGLGPKATIGTYGELHPKVLEAFGVKGPAVAFEAMLDAIPLPKGKGPSRGALEMSNLQPVERDFAFLVDDKVAAQDVANAAQGADRSLIESVRVFDEFRGLEGGKKSLALAVRMQPKEKTLTEDEIGRVSDAIVAKVGRATGGVLRG